MPSRCTCERGGDLMTHTNKVRKFFSSKLFTLIAIWIVLLIIFTIWAGAIDANFLSIQTIVDIGDLLILSSFLAVGAGFLMVAGNLDLSSSAIGAFSSICVAAALKYWGFGPIPAIIAAIVASTIFGIINGVLVNEFRFQPFIATMAMASVIRGVAQWISVEPGKVVPGPVNIKNAVTTFIAGGKFFNMIPYTLVFAIIIFIIYGLILAKSKFGMQIYLVGGNPQAARLSGISPRKMKYILYANSGFLAGICGVIYFGRLNQGSLNALMNNQFTGLTAAILGGVSFGGGTGNLAGVFVGLMVLNTFTKGTTIVRFSTYWSTVFMGILLLLALTMDYISARSANKSVGLIKTRHSRAAGKE